MRSLETQLTRVLAVDALRELVVSWLSYEDKVWLWICALELELDEFARFLRYQATSSTFPDDNVLVEMAMGCGCFNTAHQLISKTVSIERNHLRSATAWMRWFEENSPQVYSGNVLEEAAENGDFTLVQWLHMTCEYNSEAAAIAAARRGHLEVAQWLLEHHANDENAERAIHVEIPFGELEILVWTVTNWSLVERWFAMQDPRVKASGVVINSFDVNELLPRSNHDSANILSFVVFVGDFNLLEGLFTNEGSQNEVRVDEAAGLAARLGRLDMLRYLEEQHKRDLPDYVVYQAARSGCLEVLQWIMVPHRFGTLNPELLLCAGAASGNQNVIDWICASFPTIQLATTDDLPIDAATNVDYTEDLKNPAVAEALEWLCVNDRMIPKRWMIEVACQAGRLSLLRIVVSSIEMNQESYWALSRGWYEVCCKGFIDIVEFVYEELAIHHEYGFESALSRGQRQVAEYLFRADPHMCRPIPKKTVLFMIYDGHMKLVNWIFSINKVDLDTPWRNLIHGYFKTVALRDDIAGRYRDDVRDDTKMNVVAQWVLKCDEFSIEDVQVVAKWAAQRGQVNVLRSATAVIITRCDRSDRPTELQKLLHVATEYTTLGDLVQTILEEEPEFADSSVAEWAALYDHKRVLDRWITTSAMPTEMLESRETFSVRRVIAGIISVLPRR